jgi:hypothetical protein
MTLTCQIFVTSDIHRIDRPCDPEKLMRHLQKLGSVCTRLCFPRGGQAYAFCFRLSSVGPVAAEDRITEERFQLAVDLSPARPPCLN